MAPYIFGERAKIHIVNLEKTLPLFSDAMNFLGKLAAGKGVILFVGTKRAAQEVMQEEASRAAMPYVSRRWMGGTLTNFRTIRQSIKRLTDLQRMSEDGSLERLTKKEALMNRRELDKLERALGGIQRMDRLPDALFVIDVGYEKIAIREANKLGIPVVGVVDTNNPPDGVDYLVPGNDDAISAIRLYASAAADAIIEGRAVAATTAGDEFVEVEEAEPVSGSSQADQTAG